MGENIWNRKMVLTTTDNQKDALSHTDEGIEILKNDELKIVTMDEMRKFNDEFTILGNERLSPNMMLMLSPYDDKTYVKVDDSRTQLALEKGLLTVRFCSLLGVTSIKVINIKQTDLDKKIDAMARGGAKGYSAEVQANIETLERIKNQISVVATAKGGKPKLEIAERLLQENNLKSDPFFKNLLNMVKDYEGEENRIGTITQNVLLSHSMSDSLEIVGNLKFPMGYVKGSYKSVLTQKEEIYMSLEISFE